METRRGDSKGSADIIDLATGQMRVGGASARPVIVETPFGITFSGNDFVRRDRGVCPFCRKIVPADTHLPYAAEAHGDGTCRGIGLPTGPAPLDESS